MDFTNGTDQVRDSGNPISTSAVVSVTNLCGDCSQKRPTSICMPICFLVREQAKSLVAIQELEKRVKCLESSQSDVVSAVSEVHNYFSVDGREQLLLSPSTPVYESSPENFKQNFVSPFRNKLSSKCSFSTPTSPNNNKSPHCKYSFSKLFVPDTETSQKILSVDSKDVPPDSDKQDSGLDSDCREQGLESNIPLNEIIPCNKQLSSTPVENGSDELLELLDEISHKSEILCQTITSEERNVSLPNISDEMKKLHHEHSELHRLLCDIKEEREDLNSKINNLECTTGELTSKNKNLQKDFMTLLMEKRKLETKLQNFSEISGEINDDDSSTSSESKHIFSKSIHKIDSSVVSAVLKESDLLDLQKQALTYFMEKEILSFKLEQMEQLYASKEFEKEHLEKLAKEEIRELMSENEHLRINLKEHKLESAALKAKVRMLERVLQLVTLENRELNEQLGETFCLHETLNASNRNAERLSTSNFNSTISSRLSRHLSLPAQNKERDVPVNCSKVKVTPNTSSFINVTIEDPESSDPELAMMLEPAFRFSQRRSSTPLAFGKKHIKFSDMSNLPSVRLSSCKSQQAISSKQVNKKLAFNMQKFGNNIPSFKEFSTRNAAAKEAAASSGDKLNKVANRSPNKPLGMIEEKPNDPKTFPFYTILEKLKANSDYKFPAKCEEQDLNHLEENNSTSAQKCNSAGMQEAQTKEHGGVTEHSKTIHKRIQDILDRITSEPEEAVV